MWFQKIWPLTFVLTMFKSRIHVLKLVITFEVLYEECSKNDLLHKLNTRALITAHTDLKRSQAENGASRRFASQVLNHAKEQMACLKHALQMFWKQTSENMKTGWHNVIIVLLMVWICMDTQYMSGLAALSSANLASPWIELILTEENISAQPR